MIGRLLLAVVMSAAIAASGFAQEPTASALKIDGGWSRVAPPGAPVLGGYLSITNGGDRPDRLVSITSPVSDDVQIHLSSIVDGVAKMRQVTDGVEIPAGETVRFEPGGLHLMLLKPKSRPREGEAIPVTLTFATAGPVDIELAVARSPPTAAEHQGHQQ